MPRKRKRTEGKEVPLDSDDDEWKLESKEGKEEPIKEPIEVKEEEIEEEKPKKKRKSHPRFVPEDKQLWKRFPDVFKQLDPAKNVGIDLRNLSYASHQVLTWTCLVHETCAEHVWKASVKNRTILGSGCPFCCQIAGEKRYCNCTRPTYLTADGSHKPGLEHMKRCAKCMKEKPNSQFRDDKRRNDGFQSSCSECVKIGTSINPAIIRLFLRGKKCQDCGELNDIVLEFDHINNDKFKIKKRRNRGMSVLDPYQLCLEIKKTEIVCVKCHRQRTYSRYAGSVSLSKQSMLKQKLTKKLKLKQKCCVHCETQITKDNIRLFDLDHIEPKTKVLAVSQMISKNKYSLDDVEAEIRKCQLLCCNCHRIKTAKDLKHRKLSDFSEEIIIKARKFLDKHFEKDADGQYIHLNPVKISTEAKVYSFHLIKHK